MAMVGIAVFPSMLAKTRRSHSNRLTQGKASAGRMFGRILFHNGFNVLNNFKRGLLLVNNRIKKGLLIANGLRNVVFGILRNVQGIKKGIKYVLGVGVIPGVRVGQATIKTPGKVQEYIITAAADLRNFEMKILSSVLNNIKRFVTAGLGDVKAFDFRRSDVMVLLYPTGLCSCLSNTIKAVMNLGFSIRKTFQDHVRAALAYAIYVGVDLVMKGFDEGLKIFGDCLPLPQVDLPVDNILVSSVQSGPMQVCGISSLRPVYNVTLTRDDEHFLIIGMPFKCKHLVVRSAGITVPDGKREPFVDNEPLTVHIATVEMSSEIKFRPGNFLTFLQIHFNLEKLEDFKMKFTSVKHSPVMDTVEWLSDTIGKVVKSEINKKISKLEHLVSDVIEGRK